MAQAKREKAAAESAKVQAEHEKAQAEHDKATAELLKCQAETTARWVEQARATAVAALRRQQRLASVRQKRHGSRKLPG